MRITLHSLIPAAAMLAAAALSTTPAMAESTVKVPFSFVSDGHNCPAGVYSVSETNYNNTVTLHGPTQSFTWMVIPGDSAPSDKRVILKFDQIGQTYLLRSIQYHADTTSRLDKKARDLESAQERTLSGQGQ